MSISSNPFEIRRKIQLLLLAGGVLLASSLSAQEDPLHLNTVLDIDSLYQPVVSREVHGATAAALIEELQTKHYAAVEINDNFSALSTSSLTS